VRRPAELRQHRLAAKLTIEQVAETLEWSPGKISKIENARVSVMPRELTAPGDRVPDVGLGRGRPDAGHRAGQASPSPAAPA